MTMFNTNLHIPQRVGGMFWIDGLLKFTFQVNSQLTLHYCPQVSMSVVIIAQFVWTIQWLRFGSNGWGITV